MKMCRITIKAPIGQLNSPLVGASKRCPNFVYMSTVQGILSRLFGEEFHYKDAIPFSYSFVFSYPYKQFYDIKMLRYTRNKNNQDSIVAFKDQIYINPTLRIYLPISYCSKEFVNSVYMFSPSFPADVERDVVDLKTVSQFKKRDRVYTGGSLVLLEDNFIQKTILMTTPIEYKYINPYKRVPVVSGTYGYFGQGTINTIGQLIDMFGNYIDNVFIDPTINNERRRIVGRLVVLVDKDPVKIFGGEHNE